jgi:hypothetical protein
LWIVGGVGLQILRWSGLLPSSSEDSWAWRLGPGVVLGILILYLLRLATTRDAFLALLVLFAALDVWRSLRSESNRITFQLRRDLLQSQPLEILRDSALVALVIGISLAKVWPWVIPTMAGLGLVIVATLLPGMGVAGRWLTSLGIACSAVALFVFARDTRSELWWMLADDFQWFEARVWSLIQLGPQVEPIEAGKTWEAAVTYHNGAYFLAGLIQQLVQETTYTVLARFLPVLMALVLGASSAALVMETNCWYPHISRHRLLVGIALIPLLVPITPESPSNSLGISAILASICIGLRTIRGRNSWFGAAVCAAMMPATVLAKAPFVYASALTVSSLLISQPHKMRRELVTFISLGLGLWFFLRSATPLSGDFRLSPFSPSSIFELAEGSAPVRLLALLIVFAQLAPGAILGCILLLTERTASLRSLLVGCLITMFAGYAARFIVGGKIETIRYLWLPALISSTIIILVAINSVSTKQLRAGKTLEAMILAGSVATLWLIVIPHLIPNLNSGSLLAKTYRVWRSPDFFQFLFVISVALVLGGCISKTAKYLKLPEPSSRSLTASILSVALVAGVVSIGNQLPDIVQNMRETKLGISDSNREEWIGTADLRQASSFLKNSTPSDSLVALTLCDANDSNCGNLDFSFAAYGQRRFLALWVPEWPSGTLEIIDAESSTIQKNGSISELLTYWKRRDVDYGVIDKALVGKDVQTEIEKSNKIVFENARYQIIELLKE